MDRLHIAQPAVAAYEAALAAKSSLLRQGQHSDDGLPLPPARMRTQVGPLHADARFFLESGRHNAELIRSVLAEQGAPVERLGAMLDWGCGCGRVLRHWSGLDTTTVSGCDINPKMVDWCRTNLPFAEVAVNELSPPLPYADSSFDLVYAFSVMTHLSADLQHEWVAESRRVLRPTDCAEQRESRDGSVARDHEGAMLGVVSALRQLEHLERTVDVRRHAE